MNPNNVTYRELELLRQIKKLTKQKKKINNKIKKLEQARDELRG